MKMLHFTQNPWFTFWFQMIFFETLNNVFLTEEMKTQVTFFTGTIFPNSVPKPG